METINVKDELEGCVYPVLGQNDSFNNTPTPYEINTKELAKTLIKIDSNTYKIKEPDCCIFISIFWFLTVIDLFVTISCLVGRNPLWVVFVCFFAMSIMPVIFGAFSLWKILKLDNNSISITKKRMLFCFNSTVVYNSGELKCAGIFHNIINDEDGKNEYYEASLVTTSGQKIRIVKIGKNININNFKFFIDILNEHIKNNMQK